jgi:hypothetical protein
LAWNAPETFQANGGKYSEKSDAYSFSMVTYETSTFIKPTGMATEMFKVQTYVEQMGAIAGEQEAKWLEENPLENRRPDLDKVQPGCPELLMSLMKACWADSLDKGPAFCQIVDVLKKLQYPNWPCIEGFFSKIEPDKNLLKRLKQRNAGASDMDKLVDTVQDFDPHNESQEIRNVLTRFATFISNVKPTFQVFASRLSDAHLRNVRILHLSGHFDFLAHVGRHRVEGTVECVVLNACKSEGLGNKLRDIGVSHVVCWRSNVQDTTATQFAVQFYKSLDKIHPDNNCPIWNYKQAFNEACAGIDSGMDSCMASGGGGFRRMLEPHEDPCAVDYVRLLSKDGDEYPQTENMTKNHKTKLLKL